MAIEEARHAIRSNNIEHVLSVARNVPPEEAGEMLELYEAYYNKEMTIARIVQDILARIKARRVKEKIPNTGHYTCILEE